MNTSAFLVNLAIAIKETGFQAAAARIQVRAPSNSEWSNWEAGMAITINDGWEYRMAPEKQEPPKENNMTEYLDFIRELADLIEEIGYENALNSVEYQFKSEGWSTLRDCSRIPSCCKDFTYRIKPATTQHPGGKMPQHVSCESFKSSKRDQFYCTPFHEQHAHKDWLIHTYGDKNAHKMAFDTAEKAKAAEKIMRGF